MIYESVRFLKFDCIKLEDLIDVLNYLYIICPCNHKYLRIG